jgi:TonB family protein
MATLETAWRKSDGPVSYNGGKTTVELGDRIQLRGWLRVTTFPRAILGLMAKGKFSVAVGVVTMLLVVSVSAAGVEAAGPTFAEVAEELEEEAEKAFAEERWSDAVEAYGRLVGHLLEGGYVEAGDAIAAFRLRIAVAFRNNGDFAAARTMLLHLAEAAPDYEAARRQALLDEVRAALGLPPPPRPPAGKPVEAPRIEGPLRAGGDVTRPEKISSFEPEYTREARRARIQGVVIIEATIDEFGNVTDARVLKPLPMGLDRAAVDAVKRWKFRPATLNGQPVSIYQNLTVNFRLP